MFFQDCLVLMNTCLFYLKQNKGLRPFVVIVVVQNALVPGEIALTFFINMESTYLLGIEIFFRFIYEIYSFARSKYISIGILYNLRVSLSNKAGDFFI